MSEFFRALEQAERDRALRHQADDASVADILAPPPDAVPAAPASPPPPPPAAPHHVTTLVPADTHDVADADGIDAHLVSLLRPTSIEAEQYRVLRHIVEQTRAGDHCIVVAVSSPAAGDGKTVTSINLAGALAQDPTARVLLVDSDLRQPAVERRLGGGAGDAGLIEAISNSRLGLNDVVRRRAQFNMSILPAGRHTAAPYELLNSPRLAELLDAARHRYDYIVLDTPPVVPFPDCRVLGKLVDGFFLVVAAHRTPRGLLEEALNVMEPSKVLGLVFNGAERPLASYYDARYGRPAETHPTRRPRWPRRKSG